MHSRATPLQPCFVQRELLHNQDFFGSMYVCKSKRGAKNKEAYKLPHKLIEKKRRDRINECISHLKDQLPQHLKLTTLGQLERAVILESTLKHLKALTTLTEQQHQRIIALQNGGAPLAAGPRSDFDLSRHGLQACVDRPDRLERWSGGEQTDGQRSLCGQATEHSSRGESGGGGVRNRVPVIIRRARAAEPSGSDTDTDSGYGGDGERSEGRGKGSEPDDQPPAKRARVVAEPQPDPAVRTLGTDTVPPLTHTPPLCLPLYFLTPPATTHYSPTLDKSGLQSYWYPSHFPVFYPHLPALPPNPRLTQVPAPDMLGPCSPGALAVPAVGEQRGTSPLTRLLQSITCHTLPTITPPLSPSLMYNGSTERYKALLPTRLHSELV